MSSPVSSVTTDEEQETLEGISLGQSGNDAPSLTIDLMIDGGAVIAIKLT